MPKQDTLQRSKEIYADLKEAWRENHERMKEDLIFGDPVNPQQWDDDAKNARKGRVMLTLDRSNQYIVQVINQARMNKPSMNAMPVDSRADIAVANTLDGILRHIEYRSRAQIAYDWSLEGAARPGVGWIRVHPKVYDAETNEQEICIDRVLDHLSIVIDGDQPDGSDSMNGFAETLISKRQFERDYPKAKPVSWHADGSDGWVQGDMVRICEHQFVEEEEQNRIVIAEPDTGEQMTLSEDEYWELAGRIGFQPPVFRTYKAQVRKVKWLKFSGAEVLEETELPGKYIGMIPVIGYESFVDGKRQICGMTRRLMESQRAYNYERSALVEAVALQPKAPTMVPSESMEGYEDHWAKLNSGQPAYLPYNALDQEGRQLPPPQRLAPPTFPTAFAQGGQIAISDMEASVGMFSANLGQPNNATSGRQERERKAQGAAATFHFPDNQARSIEHLGRVIVGMIPTVYDTRRQAKILGMDGQQSEVMIDPKMQNAVEKRGSKVIAINPAVGSYDVRVKTGPSYTTQREEAAEGLTAVLQAAPNFAPVLAPTLVKLKDWPEAEKVSRMLLAMAPPQVQQIANEGQSEEEPIPPQVQAQMQQMQQQMAQMAQMLDAANAELEKVAGERADKALQAQKLQLDAQTQAQKHDIDRQKLELEAMKLVLEQRQAQQESIGKREVEAKDAEQSQALATQIQAIEQALMELAKNSGQGDAMAGVAQALDAVQQQVSAVGQEVEQTVQASKVVAVEKIRDANGVMIAARLSRADGSVQEVPIQ